MITQAYRVVLPRGLPLACLSSSVKSLRVLSPTAAGCVRSWVRILLLWVHSVASLQPEADGLQGLQNQRAFHNFSSIGLRKPLELARQDLRVVDEVVLLLISMFQQIRASRQSPIPGSRQTIRAQHLMLVSIRTSSLTAQRALAAVLV